MGIERGFYVIVRWFGLIMTTVALLIAIVAAVNGVSKLLYKPDTSFKQPTTTYADFRRAPVASHKEGEPIASNPTLEHKLIDSAAERKAAEDASAKLLRQHLDAIVSNLTSYAAESGQAKPAGQAVTDYVRSNMQQIESFGQANLPLEYVEGLDRATGDLAVDADSLAKLDIHDPRRVRWDTFLTWYSDQYIGRLSAEFLRINNEKEKALSDTAEAPLFLYGAAVAFGIFVLGVIVLVLLRIELNTRPKSF